MATIAYAVSNSLGSMTYNSNVRSAINAPLNTSQYPGVLTFRMTGIQTVPMATPAQFFPGQNPPNYADNGNMRNEYIRTSVPKFVKELQIKKGKMSAPLSIYQHSNGRRVAVSSHMNYIPPKDSSQYINNLKRNAIGKTNYKVGLPENSPISTKSYTPGYTNSILSRLRSSGYAAPPKKGAIYKK